MKIIGIIVPQRYSGGGRYLVEATGEEINAVAGRNHGTFLHNDELKVGLVFDPAPGWERVIKLNQNHDTVKKARDSLRALADLMEPIGDVVSLVDADQTESGVK